MTVDIKWSLEYYKTEGEKETKIIILYERYTERSSVCTLVLE
jgi:hypothetical protein